MNSCIYTKILLNNPNDGFFIAFSSAHHHFFVIFKNISNENLQTNFRVVWGTGRCHWSLHLAPSVAYTINFFGIKKKKKIKWKSIQTNFRVVWGIGMCYCSLQLACCACFGQFQFYNFKQKADIILSLNVPKVPVE